MKKKKLLTKNTKKDIVAHLSSSKHFKEMDKNLNKFISAINKDGVAKSLFIIPKGPLMNLTHFPSKLLSKDLNSFYKKHASDSQTYDWFPKIISGYTTNDAMSFYF